MSGVNLSLPTLVVVSGPPGAGKTRLAAGLRTQLRLPLIAKDTLKEVLGGALGVEERRESHRLGGAVFELMGAIVRELLGSGVSAIAEGNFTSRTQIFDSLPPARIGAGARRRGIGGAARAAARSRHAPPPGAL
jgi:hypothetical protein